MLGAALNIKWWKNITNIDLHGDLSKLGNKVAQDTLNYQMGKSYMGADTCVVVRCIGGHRIRFRC